MEAPKPLIEGYILNPPYSPDAGCVRDYVRSVTLGGIEGRKLHFEVEALGCIEKHIFGVFRIPLQDEREFEKVFMLRVDAP